MKMWVIGVKVKNAILMRGKRIKSTSFPCFDFCTVASIFRSLLMCIMNRSIYKQHFSVDVCIYGKWIDFGVGVCIYGKWIDCVSVMFCFFSFSCLSPIHIYFNFIIPFLFNKIKIRFYLIFE